MSQRQGSLVRTGQAPAGHINPGVGTGKSTEACILPGVPALGRGPGTCQCVAAVCCCNQLGLRWWQQRVPLLPLSPPFSSQAPCCTIMRCCEMMSSMPHALCATAKPPLHHLRGTRRLVCRRQQRAARWQTYKRRTTWPARHFIAARSAARIRPAAPRPCALPGWPNSPGVRPAICARSGP